ncbi:MULTISPECIES: hypothetical protein [Pseudomonas]|uniref:hypothetical protein n=1 Tax=Pseudomonas TaxID=286 RepID=UPI000CFF7566|nr:MULTISPECIES: hypothetical protein [Pseudomonas]PRA59122.1 hypothetical protein CQZ98_04630 [Pseudomonas sp. MYb115]QXN49008.1 hypothetical protein KW062_22440 [Pseudomonas fluorescens]WSO23319.1 hypothetical protein VUJ50_22595 [Pseudomonas fluorescens]
MNVTNTPIPVSLMGQTFSANDERMWHLNEIHKGLNLPDRKSPSEWRNAVSVELRTSGNLRSLDGSGTFADELGTIAYAMWVSTDFYLMVAGAFVAMRNNAVGELRSAKTLLDANMPKASTLDMKARGAGLTWTEACRVAGIQQSRLALEALVTLGNFVYPVDNFGAREGSPRPHKQGFEVGAFVKVSSDFGNREGWRVKPRGLDWLRKNAEAVNLRVAEVKARKDKAQRDAKARLKENLKASSPEF